MTLTATLGEIAGIVPTVLKPKCPRKPREPSAKDRKIKQLLIEAHSLRACVRRLKLELEAHGLVVPTPELRMWHREARYKERLLREGRCLGCRRFRDANEEEEPRSRVYCLSCREKKNERSRLRAATHKRAPVPCPVCKKTLTSGGKCKRCKTLIQWNRAHGLGRDKL